ncbi:MAG: ubiquitin-conjugating enzyme E2 [Thermoleophilia bacterium]|jgi:hypothetical protein
MLVTIEAPIGADDALVEVDILASHTIGEVKNQVSTALGVDPNTVSLVYGGEPLDDGLTVQQAGIIDRSRLALMPFNMKGGADAARLMNERTVLLKEFPTIQAFGNPPTKYEGLMRCSRGRVLELAQQGVFPFSEYTKWHRFRIEVPSDYPLKSPVVTWLTEIPHPNIVPGVANGVCVVGLGSKWKPNYSLAMIVNALSFLLVNPNGDDPFNGRDNMACVKAAEVCKEYGFAYGRT